MKANIKLVPIIECIMSNPNGDPNSGGVPREINGCGHITGTSFKRKLRDYVLGEELGGIFIQSGSITQEAVKAFEVEDATATEKKSKKGEVKTRVDLPNFMAKNWDVRLFGQVLANSGQRIRGCVQVGELLTPHQVQVESIGLSTCFVQNRDQKDKNDGTLGRRSVVQYGIYSGVVSVNARQAARHNVTTRDIGLLVESMLNGYQYSVSSSRPNVQVVSVLIAVTGDNTMVNPLETEGFSQYRLITKENPTGRADWKVENTLGVPHIVLSDMTLEADEIAAKIDALLVGGASAESVID